MRSYEPPLGAKAAAEELNVSLRTVQFWIASGKLTARKIGTGKTSAYLIERSEIERIKAGDAA